MHYCRNCGHVGRAKTHTPGSIAIELLAWLLFLIPGLIYSIWRHAARRKVCGACGSREILPANSPVARRELASLAGPPPVSRSP